MTRPEIGLPFPSGWFCVAGSAELPRGGVRALTFMGEALVLFRTTSGEIAAVDAYCPHLGAHMGEGGTVEGETLRCPFHGFRFDARGACVATAYGTKSPPRARVRSWPIREQHGLVLVYYHPDGLAPTWEVPTLDTTGWAPVLLHRWSLRGHPQETSENSVDLGHFPEVHGYSDLEVISPPTPDGPILRAKYKFRRGLGVAKLGAPLRIEIAIEVQGLGHSLVHLELPQFGLAARYFVLPVPTEEDHIDLRIGVMAKHISAPRLLEPIIGPPASLLTGALARLMMAIYKHEVSQDFEIWRHKKYLAAPVLAAGDGPIPTYRRWAAQFYERTGALEPRGPRRLHVQPSGGEPLS